MIISGDKYTMEERNCQLLFEYLRSILYDNDPQELDIRDLDEPFQKLGMGLQYLDQAVREMKSCSAALSNGNLADFTPSRDNFLCENLKNIHANLNHLTWQAKQVAKGDYSQTMSYLGEFSEAFNTMTKQLREREESLKQEAEMEKTHADMVENYNGLLLDLISRSEEDILVTSVKHPRILYSSLSTVKELQNYELYNIFLEKQEHHLLKKASEDSSYEWTWDAEDSSHHFYRITTALMEWQGEEAYAHIILEITQEKLEQDKLEQEAYFDTLTQVGNRHYFQKKLNELLDTGEDLIFCYCDLDHLKYVNDNYGHIEGDWYICHFVDIVKQNIREDDIFVRVGGDEFCLVLKGCPTDVAQKKIQQIQDDFTAESTKPYDKNFSFGIVQLPKGHETVDIDDILQRADAAMYLQKKEHKHLQNNMIT